MLQKSCIGNKADVTLFDHPRLIRCSLATLPYHSNSIPYMLLTHRFRKHFMSSGPS